MGPMLQAALAYARRGWPVVPFYEPRDGSCSCGNGKACQSAGKHPRTMHGIRDATTNEATIRQWFEQFPLANVAVVTGNGLAVLDVDTRHGGKEQLWTLFAKHGYVPASPCVETGGGGIHLYFTVSRDHRSRVIALGLELKCAGASVVAPPSLHISGVHYRWASPVESAPLPELPRWLTTISEHRNVVTPDSAQEIPTGMRHNTMLRFAGALRRVGASARAILAALEAENARCVPPLPEAELRNITASVVRYSSNGNSSHPAIQSSASPAGRTWPDPPAAAAYHGVAGEFVDIVDLHTEADRVALLAQLLAYLGNLIGRGPHFCVEASRHYTNIFPVLVGVTSKSRKGSSEAHVRALCAQVDGEWASHRILSGLSSGEGLIWQVRDAIWRRERVKERDQSAKYQEIEIDPGVSDKRVLVIEPEMASVLRVQERQGSMLSSIIRDAWDRGDLGLLTKNSPTRATAAHVTIVGHVTRDELLRYLTLTETANGFANRFLWFCVRRSKLLPDGGQLGADALLPIVGAIRKAVDFARGVGEVQRNDAARKMWREVYPELSEGRHGLYGAVTSRAEAQVVRLSLLYALLDRSAVVGATHLASALALWNYSDTSARYIFGDAVGDPTADRIVQALRSAGSDGLGRTEISELFSRNQTASQINLALATLEEHGLVRSTKVDVQKGRPTQVWSYVGATYERNEINAVTEGHGK